MLTIGNNSMQICAFVIVNMNTEHNEKDARNKKTWNHFKNAVQYFHIIYSYLYVEFFFIKIVLSHVWIRYI